MPFKLPSNLLPQETRCIVVTVPDDETYIANFWGALTELGRWYNHEQDGTHKGKVVADNWRLNVEKSLDDYLAGCGVITDLRISGGMLQKLVCGSSEWVNVGKLGQIVSYNGDTIELDLNLDGSVDVTYSTTQNDISISSLPATTDTDRICRASWELARALCDDFRDNCNRFGLSTLLLTRLAEVAISWTPAWIIQQVADETLDWFVEDLPIIVVNWIVGQATDEDTVAKVAEMIYCSLIDHYPDSLEQVLDDIPLGIYTPLFRTDLTPNVLSWVNFGELAQSIYDSVTGQFVAYLVIGFARASFTWILSFLGLQTPVEKALIKAINTAEYFDSRDCQSFGCASWSFDMNFEQQSYSQFITDFDGWSTYIVADGWAKVIKTTTENQTEIHKLVNYITVKPNVTFTIVKVTIWYYISGWAGNDQQSSEPLGLRHIVSGSLLPLDGSLSPFTSSDGLHVSVFEGNNTIDELLISFYGGQTYNQDQPHGIFTYKRLLIEGNGENPFV